MLQVRTNYFVTKGFLAFKLPVLFYTCTLELFLACVGRDTHVKKCFVSHVSLVDLEFRFPKHTLPPNVTRMDPTCSDQPCAVVRDVPLARSTETRV